MVLQKHTRTFVVDKNLFGRSANGIDSSISADDAGSRVLPVLYIIPMRADGKITA